MSQIDWSKAPDDATHACGDIWYMDNVSRWCYWSPTTLSWHTTPYASPENFSWWGDSVRRPKLDTEKDKNSAVGEMMKLTSSLGHSDVSKRIIMNALYDAGYRKFEITDDQS